MNGNSRARKKYSKLAYISKIKSKARVVPAEREQQGRAWQ